MPEGISVALPYIDQVLDAFNIPKIFADGYEADDVIGTLAKKAEKKGFVTYMMTPDKDFAQLVSPNILLYRPASKWKGTEIWGVQEVLQKFEIKEVKQVIDFLGMMGDAVDNIPGLPGVGEKTAKKFLAQFGSMENLLDNTDQLKGKLKEKIEENKEKGLLSKKLATILLDAPVDLIEKDLEVSKFDEEKLIPLFEELEFRTLAKRLLNKEVKSESDQIVKKDLQKEQKTQFDLFNQDNQEIENNFEKLESKNTEYILIDSPQKRQELIADLLQQKSVCFDTETTGLNPLNAELVGFSFCYQKNKAFYVHINEGEEQVVVNEFKPFFHSNKIEKIAQNLKYDYKILFKYGVKVNGPYFDTMIAHYLLEPDQRHNMDILAQNYLN